MKVQRLERRINKTESQLRKTKYTSQLMRILMLDLLDLAQLEQQTFKINYSDIDLQDLIGQAFAIVEHHASLKHVIFETKIDEG